MTRPAGRWIRWTTTGCVGLLALIAGTVSYLHMHMLVELHGQPGWVAALTPLSVDGMIVAASTTLLADSRAGERGGVLPWALLVAGSVASLPANVAVAQPTVAGRVIAAWPSFPLIGAYELLMRQVHRSAAGGGSKQPRKPGSQASHRNAGDRPQGVRRPAILERAGVIRAQPVMVVRAGSFSGRRGTGRWPTGPVTARCPAGVRSPASTADMSGGAAWSNAQAQQASSAVSPPNLPCAWLGSSSHQPQANDSRGHP